MSASQSLTPEQLVKKIISSVTFADVLDIAQYKDDYKKLILQIHPDRCNHPDAPAATSRLNELKDRYENGIDLKDDAGKLNTNDYRIVFKGDKDVLKASLQNYELLKRGTDENSVLLARLMPDTMKMQGDELVAEFGVGVRAIPLSGLNLPQEHVNWILSRILEFASLCELKGYAHMGLTPESIYILPDLHWIKVVSFYHVTRIGAKAKTISGAYKNWYPQSLFATKEATGKVDAEMSKKIAISLLGDRSGSGIKLKKTHNAAFVDFVTVSHDGCAECFVQYRDMLRKNFVKKFYDLNM